MMMLEHEDGSDVTYYPADRCTWRQSSVSGGYEITNGEFYPGNAAAVDLYTLGDTLTLGFIGKSGRFVPISVPSTA